MLCAHLPFVMIEIILNFRMRQDPKAQASAKPEHRLGKFSSSLRARKGWAANARLTFLWHFKPTGIRMNGV